VTALLPASLEREVATPGWAIQAAAAKGATRPTMQDAIAIEPAVETGRGRVDAVGVFDGVGGMPRGAEAASAAAAGLRPAVAGAASPQAALERLQETVQRTRGATTAVVAWLGPAGAAEVAWCGDSAAYALDGRGGVQPVTRPDAEGGFITQCLGLARMRPHAATLALPVGAAVLLCSDGVDGVVGPSLLRDALQPGGPDAPRLRAILAAVAAAGAPDNAAVVLARRRA
jgi:serine/threonine protein phosphatase PrpC